MSMVCETLGCDVEQATGVHKRFGHIAHALSIFSFKLNATENDPVISAWHKADYHQNLRAHLRYVSINTSSSSGTFIVM